MGGLRHVGLSHDLAIAIEEHGHGHGVIDAGPVMPLARVGEPRVREKGHPGDVEVEVSVLAEAGLGAAMVGTPCNDDVLAVGAGSVDPRLPRELVEVGDGHVGDEEMVAESIVGEAQGMAGPRGRRRVAGERRRKRLRAAGERLELKVVGVELVGRHRVGREPHHDVGGDGDAPVLEPDKERLVGKAITVKVEPVRVSREPEEVVNRLVERRVVVLAVEVLDLVALGLGHDVGEQERLADLGFVEVTLEAKSLAHGVVGQAQPEDVWKVGKEPSPRRAVPEADAVRQAHGGPEADGALAHGVIQPREVGGGTSQESGADLHRARVGGVVEAGVDAVIDHADAGHVHDVGEALLAAQEAFADVEHRGVVGPPDFEADGQGDALRAPREAVQPWDP